MVCRIFRLALNVRATPANDSTQVSAHCFSAVSREWWIKMFPVAASSLTLDAVLDNFWTFSRSGKRTYQLWINQTVNILVHTHIYTTYTYYIYAPWHLAFPKANRLYWFVLVLLFFMLAFLTGYINHANKELKLKWAKHIYMIKKKFCHIWHWLHLRNRIKIFTPFAHTICGKILV